MLDFVEIDQADVVVVIVDDAAGAFGFDSTAVAVVVAAAGVFEQRMEFVGACWEHLDLRKRDSYSEGDYFRDSAAVAVVAAAAVVVVAPVVVEDCYILQVLFSLQLFADIASFALDVDIVDSGSSIQ